MPLTKSRRDPTHTVTLRKSWIREVDKRFNKLRATINNALLRDQLPSSISTNASAFEFKDDPQQVVNFLQWLQVQVGQIIFDNRESAGNSPDDFWQNQHIDRAYLRGIEFAKSKLRKQQPALGSLLQAATVPDLIGTATPSLLFETADVFAGQPIHLDAIQVLFTRDYAELKGITEAMSQQIARTLTDGVEQGLGIKEVAKNMTDRVNKIGKTRARLLARTETVHAYNVGAINEGDDLSQDIDVEVKYRWSTSQDDRVRNTHAARHNKLYTKRKALALIGEPNCRCSIQPEVVE